MPRWPYLFLLAFQAALAAAAFAAWKGAFADSVGTIPGYWVAIAVALLLGTTLFVFLGRET